MTDVCTCESIQEQLDEINEKQDEILDEVNNIVISTQTQPILIFILLIFLFIVFDFWSEAIHSFINKTLHKGKEPSWQITTVYAVVLTIVFFIIIAIFGVPLVTLESA